MKSWKVYVQLFNHTSVYAMYVTIQVPITEDQYNELSAAVAENEPLRLCSVCSDLESKIEMSDPQEILKKAGVSPDEDDFMEDEEIEEDDEEWEINRADVEDPNEEKRLNEYFVGKTYPKWSNQEETFSFEENDDNRDVMYDVSVCFDEEGTVLEVTILSSEGVENGDERHIYTNEAYPDYEFIKEQLEKELRD